MLTKAWELYYQFDLNARIQQNRYRRYQGTLLFLGLIGTLLAILPSLIGRLRPESSGKTTAGAIALFVEDRPAKKLKVLEPRSNRRAPETEGIVETTRNSTAAWPVKIVLALVTASASALVTWLGRSKPGEKWLKLRAGAQSILQEIFLYRAHAGNYQSQANSEANGKLLYHRLNILTKGLDGIVLEEDDRSRPPDSSLSSAPQSNSRSKSQSDSQSQSQSQSQSLSVARSAADVKDGRVDTDEADDGYSFLTPERYIKYRLDDQYRFYKSRIVKYNRLSQRWHLASIVAGALGTILSLLDSVEWVPVTTAITTACLSHLQQRQIDTTLTQYDMSYKGLMRLKLWWEGELTDAERATPRMFEHLVTSTEEILASELSAWTQQWNAALSPNKDKENEHKDEQNHEANHRGRAQGRVSHTTTPEREVEEIVQGIGTK